MKCQFCKKKTGLLIFDCNYCNKSFCSKCRDVLSHKCSNIDDCKKRKKDELKERLISEKVVKSKLILIK